MAQLRALSQLWDPIMSIPLPGMLEGAVAAKAKAKGLLKLPFPSLDPRPVPNHTGLQSPSGSKQYLGPTRVGVTAARKAVAFYRAEPFSLQLQPHMCIWATC